MCVCMHASEQAHVRTYAYTYVCLYVCIHVCVKEMQILDVFINENSTPVHRETHPTSNTSSTSRRAFSLRAARSWSAWASLPNSNRITYIYIYIYIFFYLFIYLINTIYYIFILYYQL